MQHNHVNMRLNYVHIIMLTCTMTYKIILSTYNILLFYVVTISHMLSQWLFKLTRIILQVGDRSMPPYICDIPITLLDTVCDIPITLLDTVCDIPITLLDTVCDILISFYFPYLLFFDASMILWIISSSVVNSSTGIKKEI